MQTDTHVETAATGPDAINSSRRNGKPASCEPCRLNKTKCDHKYPKCDRCIQRGIVERCFYHPAPLTKQRDGERLPSTSRPLKRKRVVPVNIEDIVPTPLISQHDRLADAIPADTNRPGYLGPTSHEAILPRDEASLHQRGASVESDNSNSELNHQYALSKSIRTQMATEILSSLRHYSLMQEAIEWWHHGCHAAFIPLPIDLMLISALRPVVERFNLENSVPDPRLVSMVLDNSSRPLAMPSDLKACDLDKICSGDKVRFETIGLLFSTASRALWFGACHEFFDENPNETPNLKARIIDELLRASTACVMLTSMISPVSDLLIWMLMSNYLFSVMVCGVSGPPTWQRMGDVTTQLYALGLHRESNAVDMPIWLRETRRRLFCSAYLQDKTLSTFLGRPLRISKRHTDIKMPLDLSDVEIMGDDSTLQAAINALSEDGWNTHGRYLRASWVRLRYIAAMYREEILDLASAKLDDAVEAQLHDISRRIRDSWAAIPQHLRYWPTCWDDLIPSTCEMLISYSQSHWYNEFMVQRLLQHKQPLTSNTPLLRVSTNILANTLTLGSIRDRSYDIYRDFLIDLILFGIPAASVLASALQDQHRTGAPFPQGISRAETIRMLSVLISHLDSAAHLENSSARPREANYALCRKACKAFTRIVDNVLEGRQRGEGEVTPTTTDPQVELGLDVFTAPGLEGFEGFEGFDFAALDDGFDWGGVLE